MSTDRLEQLEEVFDRLNEEGLTFAAQDLGRVIDRLADELPLTPAQEDLASRHLQED
jgi:hypothetical protein